MCVGFSCDTSEKQHHCITSICWNQQEASFSCQVILLLVKSDCSNCFFFKWSPLSNCCPVSDQHVKYMPWIWDALFQVCQVSTSTPYRKMLSSHWDQPKCRSSCDTVSRRRGTLFFLQFYFYKLFSRLLMLLFTSPLLPIWTILWNFYCNLFFGEYNETLTQTTNDEIHVK